VKFLVALTAALGIFCQPLVVYASCPADLNPITKGQRAPCTGILFTEEAAAKIIADLEAAHAECEIRIQKEKEKHDAQCAAALQVEKIKCDASKQALSERLSLCTKDLDLVTAELSKKSSHNLRWFSLGTVTGIVFTLVTAWTIGKVVSD
jgi:hypothetical protein